MNGRNSTRHTARLVLTFFLVTFLLSRILVLLIMTRRIPDLFIYVGETHVHHLNYGIFLLAAVGGWLIFLRPSGRSSRLAAALYAIGLALTFDEFGMWLHLGGSYWQRASFDAVVLIAAMLAMLAYCPTPREVRREHVFVALLLALCLIVFGSLVGDRLRSVAPKLRQIEQAAPR